MSGYIQKASGVLVSAAIAMSAPAEAQSQKTSQSFEKPVANTPIALRSHFDLANVAETPRKETEFRIIPEEEKPRENVIWRQDFDGGSFKVKGKKATLTIELPHLIKK